MGTKFNVFFFFVFVKVAIDTIVANGEAQTDGRLRKGDIILAVDGTNVVDASHKRVITLMQTAGSKGKVTLRVRRQDDGMD